MKINDIVARINKKLAGETLSYAQLKYFLDDVIDDINEDLGAIYPAFSDLESTVDEYTAFPDKWIRSIVVIGAAWYFFVADEEGIDTASTYQALYFENRFKMQRDLVGHVPEQYQKGYVDPSTLEEGEEAPEPDHFGTISAKGKGVTVSGTIWRL